MRLRLRHVAAFLALLAGRAVASPPLGPVAIDQVPAGGLEVVTLGPAAAGVEERELVLSLDGGRTFPLRLTGEIAPGDLQATWRVPTLPTRNAVLALREGGTGRGEEIVALSPEFTIISSPGLPIEELRFRDGEWRTREADAGDDGLPVPSLGNTAPESCERLIPDADVSEEPARALIASPHGQWAAEEVLALADVACGSPLPALSAQVLPLRE